MTRYIIEYRWLWATIVILFSMIEAWELRVIPLLKNAFKEAERRGLLWDERFEFATLILKAFRSQEMRERPLLHRATNTLILLFIGLFLLSFFLDG